MYLSALECKFQLFSLLMPITVVAPLHFDLDAEERMIKCKSLFDMEILRNRGLDVV